jgi:hypothetical protein
MAAFSALAITSALRFLMPIINAKPQKADKNNENKIE